MDVVTPTGTFDARFNSGSFANTDGGDPNRPNNKCLLAKRASRDHSQIVLGNNFLVDDATQLRIKWAQRGIAIGGFFGLLFYVLGSIVQSDVLRTISVVFGGMGVVFCIFFYYNNISLVMIKRLLKEANVLMIALLSLCLWAIDIGVPDNSLSPVYGLVYVLIVNTFVFLDALVSKSRYMILSFGILFVALNIFNLYFHTLGTWAKGTVLLSYTIKGENYTIMKRSTKRSIFLQILMFSASGMYTMLKDTKMELMMFATGKIYKSTGTASKMDSTFALKVKEEIDSHRKGNAIV